MYHISVYDRFINELNPITSSHFRNYPQGYKAYNDHYIPWLITNVFKIKCSSHPIVNGHGFKSTIAELESDRWSHDRTADSHQKWKSSFKRVQTPLAILALMAWIEALDGFVVFDSPTFPAWPPRLRTSHGKGGKSSSRGPPISSRTTHRNRANIPTWIGHVRYIRPCKRRTTCSRIVI